MMKNKKRIEILRLVPGPVTIRSLSASSRNSLAFLGSLHSIHVFNARGASSWPLNSRIRQGTAGEGSLVTRETEAVNWLPILEHSPDCEPFLPSLCRA